MESLRVGPSTSTQNVVHIDPAEDVAVSVIKSGAVKLTVGEAGVAVAGSFGIGGATPAAQQTHVADASTAHALAAIFSDTEVEAALNALGTKINSILDVLEAFGLMAP